REKDGKLPIAYAGWDDVKVVLLGTSPLAEADCAPFMTRGPDPLDHLWRPPYPLALPNSHKTWSGLVPPVALRCRSLAEAAGGAIHARWAGPLKGHLWRALYPRLSQTRRRWKRGWPQVS